jgi:hypothetical protein
MVAPVLFIMEDAAEPLEKAAATAAVPPQISA